MAVTVPKTRTLYLIDFMGELSRGLPRQLAVFLKTARLQMSVDKVEHLFHKSMLASLIPRGEEA